MTEVVLAAVLGFLFAVGTFLVLRRDVVRVVWGVSIISQAANVYLVTMSSLPGSAVPFVSAGGSDAPATVDPLVQALVLTAIVIGFGTTAFALVLTYRTYEEHGTIDMFELADGTEEAETNGAVPADGGDGE
ncbi:sodium:proton antiporter [Halorubellus sp. PRR65]|uniref:sodium:proton antiporter n=1 Tax=Halorubellus sp. PRR65 TaxID=3098148 RepID=UPI002B256859|nr:sodium:proton antiporter [Halorubellus sp. PRR65]